MSTTAPDLFTLGQGIPAAALKTDFVRVVETAHGNPAFAYRMVVPGDYLQLGIATPDGHPPADQPRLLANFLGPTRDNGNPMIQLGCQGLGREIAAGAWLKFFLNRPGTTITEIRETSPLQADAVASRRTPGGVHLTFRIAARVHGNRLFLVQGTAPAGRYADHADVFGIAVATFRPVYPTANPHVEPRARHGLDGALHFEAPASWVRRTREDPPGMSGLTLLNFGGDGAPAGEIKAVSIRRSLTRGKPGLDLAEVLLAEFTRTGLRVDGVLSDTPLSARAPFAGGSLKVLTATPGPRGAAPQNIVLAAVDGPAHHFLAALLTCASNEDFHRHSVNMRALQIILETLRAGTAS